MTRTYTAFCRGNPFGTTWVDTVEADDIPGAIKAAQDKCALDVGFDPADVHVLGLVEGKVTVVFWDDQER